MSIYVGKQHEAFTIRATRPTRACALLIHGFTGTPAEMRALGEALADAGIDAHAPLLPGFGPAIDQLPHVRADDWIRTARELWEELLEQYDVPYLVGFSMGGAVALQLAVENPPHKLALLAPFWKMADRRAALLPLVKLVRGELQPYEPADLDSPKVREAFAKVDPALDLDDPVNRDWLLRDSALPTSALVELQRVGRVAGESAASLSCETLVIQGLHDETVLPDRTRELIGRIPDDVRLLEVPADHLLSWDDRPTWPLVRDAVVEFLTGTRR
ncbi:MAG: alpha/beta fold hydrolase [Thermomicrobiales bacterium]|nr:alpha/beta fold hydrolase [Thermomicrobiales bacterium]